MTRDDEQSLGGGQTFDGGAQKRDTSPQSLGDEATFAGGLGRGGPQSLGDEVTFGGGGGGKISQGALTIRVPTRSIAPPKAGIVFSTVTVSGQKEQFAFLVLIRYGGELSSYSSSSPNTMGPLHGGVQSPEGQWAEMIIGFTVNGKPIEGRYYVELDDSLNKVATETMSLGDRTYEISAGRVFLIDITAEEPRCRQVSVPLPSVPAKLETRDDVLRAGDALHESLRELDPAIDEFLD